MLPLSVFLVESYVAIIRWCYFSDYLWTELDLFSIKR